MKFNIHLSVKGSTQISKLYICISNFIESGILFVSCFPHRWSLMNHIHRALRKQPFQHINVRSATLDRPVSSVVEHWRVMIRLMSDERLLARFLFQQEKETPYLTGVSVSCCNKKRANTRSSDISRMILV